MAICSMCDVEHFRFRDVLHTKPQSLCGECHAAYMRKNRAMLYLPYPSAPEKRNIVGPVTCKPRLRFEDMNYVKPAFSVQEVNAAGKYYSNLDGSTFNIEDLIKAVSVIENWRASHHFALNSFTVTLKQRARKIFHHALVVQRIKRLTSIADKLSIRSDMKLSQMQDIGGCRAVLPTLEKVRELRNLYDSKDLAHIRLAPKDYVLAPQATGYRGIHLKYRFNGTGKSAPWNGLKIEIQLRTDLQHKWATAVEAAGTFTKTALKSNRGSPEWLRFFALVSSVFAIREGCPTIPGTANNLHDLHAEIRQLNKAHHLVMKFAQYGAVITHVEKQREAKYYLVTLDPEKGTTHILGFKRSESREANKAYTEAERLIDSASMIQVVLVSASSIKALKRAYPNYFMDTQDFLKEIVAITGPA